MIRKAIGLKTILNQFTYKKNTDLVVDYIQQLSKSEFIEQLDDLEFIKNYGYKVEKLSAMRLLLEKAHYLNVLPILRALVAKGYPILDEDLKAAIRNLYDHSLIEYSLPCTEKVVAALRFLYETTGPLNNFSMFDLDIAHPSLMWEHWTAHALVDNALDVSRVLALYDSKMNERTLKSLIDELKDRNKQIKNIELPLSGRLKYEKTFFGLKEKFDSVFLLEKGLADDGTSLLYPSNATNYGIGTKGLLLKLKYDFTVESLKLLETIGRLDEVQNLYIEFIELYGNDESWQSQDNNLKTNYVQEFSLKLAEQFQGAISFASTENVSHNIIERHMAPAILLSTLCNPLSLGGKYQARKDIARQGLYMVTGLLGITGNPLSQFGESSYFNRYMKNPMAANHWLLNIAKHDQYKNDLLEIINNIFVAQEEMGLRAQPILRFVKSYLQHEVTCQNLHAALTSDSPNSMLNSFSYIPLSNDYQFYSRSKFYDSDESLTNDKHVKPQGACRLL